MCPAVPLPASSSYRKSSGMCSGSEHLTWTQLRYSRPSFTTKFESGTANEAAVALRVSAALLGTGTASRLPQNDFSAFKSDVHGDPSLSPNSSLTYRRSQYHALLRAVFAGTNRRARYTLPSGSYWLSRVSGSVARLSEEATGSGLYQSILTYAPALYSTDSSWTGYLLYNSVIEEYSATSTGSRPVSSAPLTTTVLALRGMYVLATCWLSRSCPRRTSPGGAAVAGVCA